jgi:hypothetical protein
MDTKTSLPKKMLNMCRDLQTKTLPPEPCLRLLRFFLILQDFLAPNPTYPFDIDLPSQPLQQGVNAAITKARIFCNANRWISALKASSAIN